MTPSELIFVFLLILLAGWAVVAFYTRRPESDFTAESSGDQVFWCDGCDYVYTDDADAERSLCPECGRMNNSVQF